MGMFGAPAFDAHELRDRLRYLREKLAGFRSNRHSREHRFKVFLSSVKQGVDQTDELLNVSADKVPDEVLAWIETQLAAQIDRLCRALRDLGENPDEA